MMHPYRIPIALQQEVDRQINELLHLKLIEPSENAYPMQNAKDLLFEVGQANYITVLDLTRATGRFNGRGGKALHSLCDSSWSLPILCYALRDEERREYLSKSYGSVLPLTELTKNRVPNIIPWNEVAEQAFTKLKAQLVKAPSLYTPDLSKPYQLYTDASATAIGACLSQNDEKGKENPIAFSLDTLRENCGIIRKQASTDGGVLWKVMCVDVVQVR
ncbi:retrovirus-related Pol polyprotein from transposon 297 [Trichonephila clavipes]|nr:retrovirus-related Pol polyprotein from transposon 297 [Trichonephila clavipes]